MPRTQQQPTTHSAAEPTDERTAPAPRSRRKLRSSTVILGGMGVLAAALSACSSEPDKRCVDRNSYDYASGYKVVDSSRCKSGSSGGGGAAGGGGSRGGVSKGKSSLGGSDPQWYYDSSKGGRHADSGTFSKSQAVDRGGFGCSGRSGSYGG